MHFAIVLEPKKNTFLDCAGLKGLNNTDPDTDNSGLSSSKFLVYLFQKYMW